MKRREQIGVIAEKEAAKCFHGKLMNLTSNLRPIADLHSPWTEENLDNLWCAAFVYYCVKLAGYDLPSSFLMKEYHSVLLDVVVG